MSKQKQRASPYCEMCAQAGHKRIAQAVINGHSVCGFHMCCMEYGEETAWPIVSNWAACKWVTEFQQLLRPLMDPFLENKDQAVKAVYDYGVRMKLDPERLRRRERMWVAGRWIDRQESADEYARRVNAYLERFIAEEAVKIARKRKEASDDRSQQ